MRVPRQPTRLVLAAVLAATAGLASAAETETVYKCIYSDGRIVYSDRPCNGQMEVQTITATEPGSGGEAALEGIRDLAREYDKRQETERKAREEAERRALEQRLANPEVVIVAPWRNDSWHYPYGYPVTPYDRYRSPPHGGLWLDDDGLSLWFGTRHPLPRHHDRPKPPPHDGGHPPRDPYSVTGEPIKEPGYSGRYPGGFPGYR